MLILNRENDILVLYDYVNNICKKKKNGKLALFSIQF